MPRGKPTNLDHFLSGGLSEPAASAAPVAQAARPVVLPTRRRSHNVNVSVRADLSAVSVLEAYAAARGVTPHALYRAALARLAVELAGDDSWQGGLDADTRRDVERAAKSLQG